MRPLPPTAAAITVLFLSAVGTAHSDNFIAGLTKSCSDFYELATYPAENPPCCGGPYGDYFYEDDLEIIESVDFAESGDFQLRFKFHKYDFHYPFWEVGAVCELPEGMNPLATGNIRREDHYVQFWSPDLVDGNGDPIIIFEKEWVEFPPYWEPQIVEEDLSVVCWEPKTYDLNFLVHPWAFYDGSPGVWYETPSCCEEFFSFDSIEAKTNATVTLSLQLETDEETITGVIAKAVPTFQHGNHNKVYFDWLKKDGFVSTSYSCTVPVGESSCEVDMGEPPADVLGVEASAQACQTTEWGVGIDQTFFADLLEADECGDSPGATSNPIFLHNGNVQVIERDPMPLMLKSSLNRTYNSRRFQSGAFGIGWSSILDSQLLEDPSTGTIHVVHPHGAERVYDLTAGVQVRPIEAEPYAYWTSTDGLHVQAPGSTIEHVYNVSTRKLREIRNSVSGLRIRLDRSVTDEIELQAYYDGDYASAIRLATAILSDGLVQTISTYDTERDDETQEITLATYSYNYLDGKLDYVDVQWLVDATGTSSTTGSDRWRTYSYTAYANTGDLLTKVEDADGNVVEEHTYDALGFGWAETDTGGGATQSVEYGEGRSGNTGETSIVVTQPSGKEVTYYQREIPFGSEATGIVKTVEVRGDCNCNLGDFHTWVYDDDGRIIMEQSADGYITERFFGLSGEHAVVEVTGIFDTDPKTTSVEDTFLTVYDLEDLRSDGPSDGPLTYNRAVTRGWDYDNNDRLSAAYEPGVLEDGGPYEKIAEYTYGPNDQLSLVEVTGNGGSVGSISQITLSTSTDFYDGTVYPAFHPDTEWDYDGDFGLGWRFDDDWRTEPQPSDLPKWIDPPLSGNGDRRFFVYYPFNADLSGGAAVVPFAAQGRIAASKDKWGGPPAKQTVYASYDRWGHARRVVNTSGVLTEAVYDGLGRLASQTVVGFDIDCDDFDDPNCEEDLTTMWQYAGASAVNKVSKPSSASTFYEYNANGLLKKIKVSPTKFAAGIDAKETFYYGSNGKNSTRFIEDGSSSTIFKQSYAYDEDGNRKRTVMPKSASDSDPAWSQVVYDRMGRVVNVTDPKHKGTGWVSTEYIYDSQGSLETVNRLIEGGGSPTYATTIYAYDAQGNLISVTDAEDNETSYAYDDFGNLLEIDSPITGVTTMEYDEDGKAVSRTDAVGNAAISLWDYGVIREIIFYCPFDPEDPDAECVWGGRSRKSNFKWDAMGRLITVLAEHGEGGDPDGGYDWKYDRLGNIVEEGSWIDKASERTWYKVRYRYDLDGNRTEMLTYPQMGRVLYSDFDGGGRPQTISVSDNNSSTTRDIATLTWLPFGPLDDITYLNGSTVATEVRAHDWQYRLTDQDVSGNGLTIDRFYDYDKNGNLVDVDEGGSAFWDYGYDDAQRLVSATMNGGPDLTYAYDLIGNRTQMTEADSPYDLVWTYDWDAVDPNPAITKTQNTTTLQTTTYQRDANGNITEFDVDTGGTHTGQGLIYSARNQLSNLEDLSQTPTHDVLESAIGPPHRIEEGDDWIDLFYDKNLKPLRRTELSNGSETEGRLFIWVGNHLLGYWIDGDDDPHFVVSDQIGLPYTTVDDSGAQVWSSTFRPFGETITASGTADPRMRYPGQVEVGQDWSVNGWRSYDGASGRYLQPDPLGLEGSFNLFLYGNASPFRFIDPLGLYGTNECSYYKIRCLESGGAYYCDIAPRWCERFDKYPDPDPSRDDDFEGWPRCTRKCLQDCDQAGFNDRKRCKDPYPFSRSKPDPETDQFTDEGPTGCHAACYTMCYLLKWGNDPVTSSPMG